MREIILSWEDIHQGSLILINKTYPLKQLNLKSALIPTNMNFPHIEMEMKAASLLSHLLQDIGGNEDIIPVSGYRSLEEQQSIYETSLIENGEAFTHKYVALPNHSEHQTGLAIDLAKKQEDIDFIRPEFPYEGICNVFRSRAADYGFVERYQKGKEEITGIAHEPWHFRYVGYPHSKHMKDMDLSLEEYIEYLKTFPKEGSHLKLRHRGQYTEVFYIGLVKRRYMRISLCEHDIVQLSGNNVDGVIVTIWRKENE